MTNGDVGVYSTAYQFTSLAGFLALAIASQTLTPKISHWSSNSQTGSNLSGDPRITMSLILAIPVAFGGILLSERLLYFTEQISSKGRLSVRFFLSCRSSRCSPCFGVGLLPPSINARQAFYAAGIAALLNIVLAVTLIPIFGINGAAVATLISYTLNAILISHFLKRYITIRLELLPIAHIVIASLVMALFVFIYIRAHPS